MEKLEMAYGRKIAHGMESSLDNPSDYNFKYGFSVYIPSSKHWVKSEKEYGSLDEVRVVKRDLLKENGFRLPKGLLFEVYRVCSEGSGFAEYLHSEGFILTDMGNTLN